MAVLCSRNTPSPSRSNLVSPLERASVSCLSSQPFPLWHEDSEAPASHPSSPPRVPHCRPLAHSVPEFPLSIGALWVEPQRSK
jgi:hypothetical protein